MIIFSAGRDGGGGWVAGDYLGLGEGGAGL